MAKKNTALQDEIHELMILVPLLEEKIVHPYQAVCPESITNSQLQVLFVLSRQDHIRMSELAETRGISKQQLTPIINFLEHRGYVKRAIDPNNRRIVTVDMTASGRKLMKQIDQRIVSALTPNFAVLSETELGTYSEAIAQIREMLMKMPSQAPSQKKIRT